VSSWFLGANDFWGGHGIWVKRRGKRQVTYRLRVERSAGEMWTIPASAREPRSCALRSSMLPRVCGLSMLFRQNCISETGELVDVAEFEHTRRQAE